MKQIYFLFFAMLLSVVVSIVSGTPLYAEDKSAIPSEARSNPLSPVIITPKEISEFRGIQDIVVLWTQVPNATAYHVRIARDRFFKRIVYENTRETQISFTIKDLDYGTYFLKISAIKNDGTAGPFSKTTSFVVVPPPPSK